MLAVQPPWREIRVQIAGVEITKKEEKMDIEVVVGVGMNYYNDIEEAK